jgi:hypothetical protein
LGHLGPEQIDNRIPPATVANNQITRDHNSR